MKIKKKVKQLEVRIKDYTATIARSKNNAQGFKKPGSLQKTKS